MMLLVNTLYLLAPWFSEMHGPFCAIVEWLLSYKIQGYASLRGHLWTGYDGIQARAIFTLFEHEGSGCCIWFRKKVRKGGLADHH
jgi:hypothetical protein